MKYLLVLSIAIAASAASVVKSPSEGYEGKSLYLPGDDADTPLLVDTQEPVGDGFLRQLARNPERNDYQLYTRANPNIGQRIHLFDQNSVDISNFDPRKNVVFIAHGWNGNGRDRMSTLLTEVFLQDGDVNVIVLDWSRLANRGYATAQDGVSGVGRHLGQFINWLACFNGVDYDRMHLVGFSLGAHLVGFAGREAGSYVRRITALDPVGLLWGRNSGRLSSTDAQYVEVIHTNSRMYGIGDPLGDADFYPNGGDSMPGCLLNPCSHNKAVEYMASSVTHNHLLANSCPSLRDASRDRCSGFLQPMGNSDLNKFISGIYRVNTRRDYPY